ncbi:hypothetical protein TCAL_16242 [Tigriopus californicus]|uniref:Uncharacterized protein n=1 Tax=Tigriopus californicus TaxID=6832 RepID=A0A553N9V5_TIGCA|nr:uncharacterized protein LOC131885446 [Tigriopus californicus]TRY62175.1 hypothetical protein TCAL_16242 [Tigriopus californicus]
MIHFSRSCCCYSPRDGAIIIGITFMICSTVALLLEIGLIVEWSDIKDNMNEHLRHFTYPLILVSFVLSFTSLIFSILLLSGVKRGKSAFLIPWLIWSVLYLFIGLASSTYEIWTGGGSLTIKIILPITYALVHGFWGYSILCVYSYYGELRQGEKDKEHDDKEAEYCSDRNNHHESGFEPEPSEKDIIYLDDLFHPKIHPHDVWRVDNEGYDNPYGYTANQRTSTRGKRKKKTFTM